mgnify:CR=1 FL=1
MSASRRPGVGSNRRSGFRGFGGGAVVALSPVADAVFRYEGATAAINGWGNTGSAGAGADLAAIGTDAALTTLDGKTVVDFAGASAGFGCAAAAFTLGASHTIYVVCRTPSSFAATRRVIGGGIGAAGAGSSILQITATPTWQLGTTDMSPTPPSVDTWYAVCLQYNGSGTDELLFVNDFTTPTQAATAAAASTCTGITVGSHSLGTVDWLGMVAAVLGYSGTHDAAARATQGAYLLQQFPSLTIA